MKIKRTLIGICVMILLVGTGLVQSTVIQASTELKAPTELKVKNTVIGADLEVTWKKVSGASEYAVYRSISKDEYNKTKEEHSASICYTDGIYYKEVGTSKNTSYIASGLKNNKTYYFRVTAHKTSADGDYSSSDVFDSKVVSCKTSKCPLYTVIDEGGQEVYFYWLWNGKTTVKDENYNNAWNKCMSILEERSSFAKGEYPFGSSKTFSTGYFVDGKEILRSTPHTTYGSGIAPTTDVQTSTKVGTTTAKVKNTAIGADLKVTWKKASNASWYTVYLSTSKKGTFKEVKTTTNTSYTTKGLKKDKTYYFKIKAFKAVSVNNHTNDDKTVTTKVKISYGSYSKVVSCKTSKYSLNTVIDKGGQEVYFYWLWDGKTGYKDANFWAAWNKCEDILRERYNNNTHGKWIGSKKKNGALGYYINGKVVDRTCPKFEFDGSTDYE